MKQTNLLLKTLSTALLLVVSILLEPSLKAQPVPAEDENIPFLVTFGKNAPTSRGDDDFSQIFFLSVPFTQRTPIYVRVFDPDVGGQHDEIYDPADTKTKFSIYGGEGAFSHEDARQDDPVGNYKSGRLLDSKVFGDDPKYDNSWYTFGPFNPEDGEKSEDGQVYYFKIIADGLTGNDGNLYSYYFSTTPNENTRIEGSNAFTYEYTFRMPEKAGSICHLYPYITKDVISVQQFNFDWDNDGYMKIVSYEKKGLRVKTSNENDWVSSKHDILPTEREASLDFQFVKSGSTPKENNNICFYITNQYGEFMPFYTIPIGGVPKYKYDGVIDKLKDRERYQSSGQ